MLVVLVLHGAWYLVPALNIEQFLEGSKTINNFFIKLLLAVWPCGW